MKLFITILLIICVSLFGDKFGARITKNELRGMYKKESEMLILELFTKSFDDIHDKIIKFATLRKNEYQFTIMCKKLLHNNCEMQNGHQVWLQNYPNNIITTLKQYITFEQHTTNIINALKKTFMDSNITKIYKNCCDYYNIKW